MKKGIFILILIVLIFSYFAFFYIKKVDVSLVNGYVSTESITRIANNLKNGNDNSIKLVEIKDTDSIFKNGLNYYIGEKNKQVIHLDVPIYEEDESRIWNYDAKNYISNDFIQVNDLKNIIVADKNIFNARNNDNIDSFDYIFEELGSGLYVNNVDITILNDNNIVIPVYSIIYFNETFINYYIKSDKELLYKSIPFIGLDQEISVNGNRIQYEELLSKLGIYGKKEEVIIEEPIDIVEPIHEEIEEDNETEEPETKIKEIEFDDTIISGNFIKPEVTFSGFVGSVYSATGTIEIKDPMEAIYSKPTFVISTKDGVYLRKTFQDAGQIKVTGLLPNTVYTLEGTFIYINENGKKVRKTFYEGTFNTKNIDILNPVKLGYEINNIYSNRVAIDNIVLLNDEDDEIFSGIAKIEVELDNRVFNMSSIDVREIANHNKVNYSTNESLNSNTDYNGKFVIYDVANNKLTTINAEFSVKTCKDIPTLELMFTDIELVGFTIKTTLNNKDNVNLQNYRYEVFNMNGLSVASGSIENSKVSNTIVTGLLPNQVYKVVIYSDMDLENGKGTIRDVVLNEGQVFTKPLSTLGTLKLNLKEKEIKSDSVEHYYQINMKNTDQMIVSLLDSIEINVKLNDMIVKTVIISGSDIDDLKNSETTIKLIEGLRSNTTYYLDFIAHLKQGDQIIDIGITSNLNEFKTMKKPAYAAITNQFSNDKIIDFDVRVIDRDEVILSDRAIIEIHDERGKFIYSNILDINGENIRVSLNNLEKDTNYKVDVIVESYNEGSTNRTYKTNYVIDGSKTIKTHMNLSGKIYLDNLLNVVTSKNIFNINNIENFRLNGESTYTKINTNTNTATLYFSASNNYENYSYYIPEYMNSVVRVKFKARQKADSNGQDAYLTIGGFSDPEIGTFPLNLTNDFKSYSIDLIPDNGYIGFGVNEVNGANNVTTIEVKEFEIIPYIKYDSDLSVDASKYDSKYYFTNGVMLSGLDEQVNPDGSSSVGHIGNGYARITDMTNNQVYDFPFAGKPEEFKAPRNGKYLIELWGASGGDQYNGTEQKASNRGGNGAYTRGEIVLNKDDILYVVVGGQGQRQVGTQICGGFNGGNKGGRYGNGFSGGGATDVRLVSGVLEEESLKTRIMVAGGGGGSGRREDCFYCGKRNTAIGGAGGALYSEGLRSQGVRHTMYGAGQLPYEIKDFEGNVILSPQLGSGDRALLDGAGGGAGGGYYGGLTSKYTNFADSGAGGSSYISGYAGCISIRYAKNIKLQDEEYNPYSEEKLYKGHFYISVKDENYLETGISSVPNNKYYIQILKNGNQVERLEYDIQNGSKNYLLEKALWTYNFERGVNYTVNLQINSNNRFYNIDSISFYTDNQIRSIYTYDELLNISTNANYLVSNDLDFSYLPINVSVSYNGKMDFQGHKVYLDNSSKSQNLFDRTMKGGIIKNANIIVNVSSNTSFNGFVYRNRGTIDNVFLTINYNTTDKINGFYGLTRENQGLITNFVVNNTKKNYAIDNYSLLVGTNNGTIKNGYLYGEMIDGNFDSGKNSEKQIGSVVSFQDQNGSVENIFSLVDVVGYNGSSTSKQRYVGSIIGVAKRGVMKNLYSYNESTTRPTNRDANVGYVSGTLNSSNAYYISPLTYTQNYSIKNNKVALWSNIFQNKTLNSENQFIVEDYVDYGFYPQLKLNDNMPIQEYVSLPELTNADLLSIIAVDILEKGDDEALISILIRNPMKEVINSFQFRNLQSEVINQVNNTDGTSSVNVRVYNPNKYVSMYAILSVQATTSEGVSYTHEFTPQGSTLDTAYVELDMKRPIYTIEDWFNIPTYTGENFVLKNDLDFENSSALLDITTFSGLIDGDNHVIRNVKSIKGQILIEELSGATIENLYLENISNNVAFTGTYSGLFGKTTNSTISNVHITNEKLKIRNSTGGIVAEATYSTLIENSSITNLSLYETSNISSISIGGIAGTTMSCVIRNTFVQDINFDIPNSSTIYSIGGIVGNNQYTAITDVYATGKINTVYQNVGGIAGRNNSRIQYAYSKVDIVTSQTYYGGIVGFLDGTNVSNVISFGDIYSSTSESVHRTIGNDDIILLNQYIYAWDKQKINGFISEEESGEILLSNDDIFDANSYGPLIDLGENFDISSLNDNILPMLTYYENDELLPNQNGVKLKSDEEDPISVKSITLSKNFDSGIAQIVFDNRNTSRFAINGIEIENAQDITPQDLTIINKNPNNDKQSIVTARFVPKYYLDSYKLSKIYYTDLSTMERKEIDTTIKINIDFYRQINSIDDFQSLNLNYAENYSINTDLDFGNVPEDIIKKNIRINKLEGNNYTISNYTINTAESDTAIFSEVMSGIRNINFDNININVTTSSKVTNIGVIGAGYGYFENVSINDFHINPYNNKSNIDYAAFVAKTYIDNYKNVTITNSSIKGGSYLGSLFSVGDHYNLSDISISNVSVTGNKDYIGGLAGQKRNMNANFLNINIDNVTVSGRAYVGLVYGYGSASNVIITNSTVNGNNNIGGFAGTTDGNGVENVKIDNVTINVELDSSISNNGKYIGLVFGNPGAQSKYIEVSNSTINGGLENIGGLYGKGSFTSGNIINNVTINSPLANNVGGLAGYSTSGCSRIVVYNSHINGNNFVGGLYGKVSDTGGESKATLISVNASIIADNDGAGGIIGHYPNLNEDQGVGIFKVTQALILNSYIEADTNAGGTIGRMEKETSLVDLISTNYVAVNIRKKSDSGSYGILAGSGDIYVANTRNNYIYDQSKLNSTNANQTQTALLGSAATFLTLSDISNKSTFDSFLVTWEFKNNNVLSGYYPTLSGVDKNNIYTVALPTQDSIGVPMLYAARRSIKNITNTVPLPNVKVYPSSESTFNIDFSSLGGYINLDNKSYEINDYTMTFTYDYQDNIKFSVYNDWYEKEYNIDYDTIRRTLYTKDNNYCYINKSSSITCNDKDVSGEFVHIFGDKALDVNGNIYSFYTSELKENNIKNYQMIDSIPLKEYDTGGNNIKTYSNYSIINDKKIDNQILVKNSTIGMVSSNLSNTKDMVIFDSYNNKKILLALIDGKVYSLMDSISIPYKLKNQDIIEMSNNLYNNTDIVLLRYSDGTVKGFNYKTGKYIDIIVEGSEQSLVDFFRNYFDDSNSDKGIISYDAEYNNTKVFVSNIISDNIISTDKLVSANSTTIINEDGSTSVNNEKVTINDFVSVYNPLKREYEVYSIGNLVRNSIKEEDANLSVNDLLNRDASIRIDDINNYKSDIMIKAYNGKYIIEVIVTVIMAFLIMLGVYIKKINVKKV